MRRRDMGLRSDGVIRVIGAVLMIATLVVVVRANIADPSVGDGRTGFVRPTTTALATVELVPEAVAASGEADGFHATHLIDGDSASYWSADTRVGEELEVVIALRELSLVTSIEIEHLSGDAGFAGHGRIRGYELHAAGLDGGTVVGELADVPGTQSISLSDFRTDSVILHATSTYAATETEDVRPHVAVAELRLIGMVGG